MMGASTIEYTSRVQIVEAMVSWNMPGMDFILGLPLVVTYSLLSTLLDHLSDGTIACLQWCYFSSLALVCSL